MVSVWSSEWVRVTQEVIGPVVKWLTQRELKRVMVKLSQINEYKACDKV